MFKLLVFAFLVSCANAAPGYIDPSWGAPAAVVHAAPLVHAPVYHAPIVHSPATSYASFQSFVGHPTVVHAAPVYAPHVVHAAPVVQKYVSAW